MKKNMYTKYLVLSIFISSVIFSYALAAPSIFDTTPITVNVTIQQITWIDTFPDKFEWLNMQPGQNGTEKDLTIENIGSTNITYIWFNVTQPPSNPFGSGLPGAYDPANWIVLRNTSMPSTVSEPYFVDTLSYVNDSQTGDKPAYFSTNSNYWGRWRIANHEFFWALNDGGNGKCNDTGDSLWISKTVHNESSTSKIDLTTCGTSCAEVNITGVQNTWGYGNLSSFNSDDNIFGSGLNYCIAVAGDCSKVRFIKWNAEAPGITQSGVGTIICPHFDYFVSPTNKLTPGQVRNAVVNIMVPYGVAHGQMKTGILQIIAAGIE